MKTAERIIGRLADGETLPNLLVFTAKMTKAIMEVNTVGLSGLSFGKNWQIQPLA